MKSTKINKVTSAKEVVLGSTKDLKENILEEFQNNVSTSSIISVEDKSSVAKNLNPTAALDLHKAKCLLRIQSNLFSINDEFPPS